MWNGNFCKFGNFIVICQTILKHAQWHVPTNWPKWICYLLHFIWNLPKFFPPKITSYIYYVECVHVAILYLNLHVLFLFFLSLSTYLLFFLSPFLVIYTCTCTPLFLHQDSITQQVTYGVWSHRWLFIKHNTLNSCIIIIWNNHYYT